MTSSLFLDAFLSAAVIAALAVAVIVPLRPDFLRFTQRIVCPPGSSMQIRIVKLTYGGPKHRGLMVVCRSPAGDKNVFARAVFWLWVMLMIPSLAIALAVLALFGSG